MGYNHRMENENTAEEYTLVDATREVQRAIRFYLEGKVTAEEAMEAICATGLHRMEA